MDDENFVDIELDVDPAIQDMLVMQYVKSHLHSASTSVFEHTLAQSDIEGALYRAVFNDAVIDVIEEEIRLNLKSND